MRISRHAAGVAVGMLAALALVSAAHAETLDAETLTLGYQTEHADAVVLADHRGEQAEGATGKREVTFAVHESIRGSLAAGANVVVVHPDMGHGRPWRAGARHLLFLRRIEFPEGLPARFSFLTGTYGIRPVPESGPASRFPGMVREIAATLGEGAEIEKPEELERLLLGWIQDADPGVVWSAATDFVRHAKLFGEIAEKDSKGIVDAYVRHPIGKASKDALALAVAAARHPKAGEVLVESLLLPESRRIRGAVGDALWRLADPEVPALVASKIAEADAGHRATLVQVLGLVGGGEQASTVQTLLEDEKDVSVRIEAAHALGRIARNVRESDPTERVRGRVELYSRILLAKHPNELRACLWALAQLDAPEAFALLRYLIENDERPLVRRLAKRYLERPRTSLVLR